jgi:hypothetical protein
MKGALTIRKIMEDVIRVLTLIVLGLKLTLLILRMLR